MITEEKNIGSKIRTLEEAFPNDKIGTFSQDAPRGTLYIPKNIEEVEEQATKDAQRLMKRFGKNE